MMALFLSLLAAERSHLRDASLTPDDGAERMPGVSGCRVTEMRYAGSLPGPGMRLRTVLGGRPAGSRVGTVGAGRGRQGLVRVDR